MKDNKSWRNRRTEINMMFDSQDDMERKIDSSARVSGEV